MCAIVTDIGMHAYAAGFAERVTGTQPVMGIVASNGGTPSETRLVSEFLKSKQPFFKVFISDN